MRRAIFAAILASISAAAVGLGTIAAAPATDPVKAAQDEIWAKELSIYSNRGNGNLDFYVNNASDKYLAWPPTSDVPFPLSRLRRDGDAMRGKTHEKIETSFKGFTLSGESAVIYYTNHRTMMADGTPTDQYYENIHAWSKSGGTWKVLGGMSRLMPAKK